MRSHGQIIYLTLVYVNFLASSQFLVKILVVELYDGPITPGMRVNVVGLESARHLNNRMGTVMHKVKCKKGRYAIQLDGIPGK